MIIRLSIQLLYQSKNLYNIIFNFNFLNTMSIKFQNPFDFMQDEEKIIINPLPEKKNQEYSIFTPYQIPSVKKQNIPFDYSPKPEPFTQKKQQIFDTNIPTYPQRRSKRKQKEYQLDENGDPPLLDDLGIDIQNIKQKMKLVITFKKPYDQVLNNPDLFGPIIIALLLGVLLLLSGKIHFGDIYGVFTIGTVLLYFLMNFMSQNILIPIYDVMSILGYGLIPILFLGLLRFILRLSGFFGLIIALSCAGWSSYSSTGFFLEVLKLNNKKWLIAYPVFLFYLTFVLITIF